MPFCRHRCGYCNFSVVAGRDDLMDRFLGAIEIELQQIAAASDSKPELDTVFIGGGTPTHLDARRLERLCEIVCDHFRITANAEWSVEANPEDINEEKLSLLHSHGVNRVSLGVQSFNDRKLNILERAHGGKQVQGIVELVSQTIENVSLDLIFAAPDETIDEWQNDLTVATSLPIKHASTYALTFEKGTSFWSRRLKGSLQETAEELELQMYDLARNHFAAAGLSHYEISNFAKPGFPCRHNLSYWEGSGWYAAGPGAAGYVDHFRNVNHRSTFAYLKRIESGQSPVAESEKVSFEQAAREAAAFGVRMIGGVDLDLISQRYDINLWQHCDAELQMMIGQGLIVRTESRIQLTEHGIHFADSVASELLG
ncbi:radical SAM family heme chaperone HemW [Stieleria sp. JC731]|nr:radical SAM family heme chaperone HemW [Stieleria sp. JC731]